MKRLLVLKTRTYADVSMRINIKRKLCQLIKTLQKFACMLAISQLLELRDQRKINSKERNLYLRIDFGKVKL